LRGGVVCYLDANLAVGLHALELLDALLDDIALDERGHHGAGLAGAAQPRGSAELRHAIACDYSPKESLQSSALSPLASLLGGFRVWPSALTWMDVLIASFIIHTLCPV